MPIAANHPHQWQHGGWFTTKKLADYIHATKTDYINARRSSTAWTKPG